MAEIRKMTTEELIEARSGLIGKFVTGECTNKEYMQLYKIEKELRKRG